MSQGCITVHGEVSWYRKLVWFALSGGWNRGDRPRLCSAEPTEGTRGKGQGMKHQPVSTRKYFIVKLTDRLLPALLQPAGVLNISSTGAPSRAFHLPSRFCQHRQAGAAAVLQPLGSLTHCSRRSQPPEAHSRVPHSPAVERSRLGHRQPLAHR